MNVGEKEVYQRLQELKYDERMIQAIMHQLGEDVSLAVLDGFLKDFNREVFLLSVIPIVKKIELKFGKSAIALTHLNVELDKKGIKAVLKRLAANYLRASNPNQQADNYNKQKKLKFKLDEVAKTVHQKENIVALQSLVNELAQDHTFLVKLDLEFCGDVLEKRPLVALLMMMNDTLRPLMERGQDELDAYIDNIDIYKQLLPYIKIQDGTTHGQWRHLVDPKKKCLVLTAKNCEIAASEQLNRTYGESESKFLVLQGLSMKATDDNAEVHYLEV